MNEAYAVMDKQIYSQLVLERAQQKRKPAASSGSAGDSSDNGAHVAHQSI